MMKRIHNSSEPVRARSFSLPPAVAATNNMTMPRATATYIPALITTARISLGPVGAPRGNEEGIKARGRAATAPQAAIRSRERLVRTRLESSASGRIGAKKHSGEMSTNRQMPPALFATDRQPQPEALPR